MSIFRQEQYLTAMGVEFITPAGSAPAGLTQFFMVSMASKSELA